MGRGVVLQKASSLLSYNVLAQLNFQNLLGTEYYASASSRLNIYPGFPLSVLGSLKFEFY